jgi:RNA ligase (TIGR02306 family)
MLINGERAMAYVVKIDDVQPIEGADRIDLYKVGGWTLVGKKGEMNKGDLACYIEIDSWVPHTIAPFLTQDGHFPKVYNEVEGQRLKTKRMKGIYSQGLLLSIHYLNDIVDLIPYEPLREGTDLTNILGIQKWELPISAELRGVVKGDFPSFIPKTDQERVQNLTRVLPNYYGESFEITEKLHGTSSTFYLNNIDDEIVFGVCSRNRELKEAETNTYWKVARESNIEIILRKFQIISGKFYALQGEIVGEGINGNMYNLKGQHFKLFDIYDITEQRYLTPYERFCMWGIANIGNETDNHIPILNAIFILDETHTAEKLLQMVEHKSTLNNKVWVEGWVLKCHDVDFSFKVVSNKFLTSKQGEDA